MGRADPACATADQALLRHVGRWDLLYTCTSACAPKEWCEGVSLTHLSCLIFHGKPNRARWQYYLQHFSADHSWGALACMMNIFGPPKFELPSPPVPSGEQQGHESPQNPRTFDWHRGHPNTRSYNLTNCTHHDQRLPSSSGGAPSRATRAWDSTIPSLGS